jgi:hypothetical protein
MGELHNGVLHNSYTSPNIIRVIKLRKMRLEGDVARMGRSGMPTGFWWENQNERDHCEDLDIGGR